MVEPVTDPKSELGPIARLIGVFTAPSTTFASIDRKPGWDWLLPAALVVIAIFTLQMMATTKIDVDDAVKTQMRFVDKMSQGKLDDASRQKIEQQTRDGIEAGKSPVRLALNSLIVLVVILIVPLIYHGIAAAFGQKKTYLRVLSGYAYTQTITIIPLLLTSAIASTRETIDATELQFYRLLKSNVAAFLDFDSTSKVLLALLSSVDVFDIWAFVVGGIALSHTTQFSRKGAYGVVGSVWGAYIAIKMVLGALYGAFGA